MNFNATTYQNKIQLYWDMYIKSRQPLPNNLDIIRDEVLDSWKRSIAYGLNPDKQPNIVLPPAKLAKLLEQNEDLLEIADTYMGEFYPYVKGTDFAMILATKDGYVIKLIADDESVQSRAKKSNLCLGCNRSERYAGTSGIAICLTTGKPFTVYDHEHFMELNKGYNCSASPIRDANGILLGCIALVGATEVSTPHTLGMVSAISKAIENELSLRNAMKQLVLLNNNLSSTLNSLTNGIILLDRQGCIIQHNNKAAELLNFSNEEDIPGLDVLLGDKDLAVSIVNTKRSIFNREVTIKSKGHKDFSLIMNVSCDSPDSPGLVLSFERKEQVHQLVSSMSGFSAKCTFETMIGNSLCMSQVKKMGMIAAKSDSNLLILGESGTGKDVLAQAIHNASDRANGPFLPINCAALPNSLIESELFGYESGAFTGAQRNGAPGKFELANGGTIFLDEIGDMPLELQTTLLRVLQNKEIVRIGGKKPIPINVRVIAATNANLEQAVIEKRFRGDLYYRLNILSIKVPPLRYRKEDIPNLIDFFTKKHTYSDKDIAYNFFTDTNVKLLTDYAWPGNVRELENMVERVIISSSASNMQFEDLLKMCMEPNHMFNDISSSVTEPPRVIENMETSQTVVSPSSSPLSEYNRIIQALAEEHGHVQSVADRLGIPRRTLYRKIQKYNIDVEQYRKW